MRGGYSKAEKARFRGVPTAESRVEKQMNFGEMWSAACPTAAFSRFIQGKAPQQIFIF
jgi:hypothetical protein